MLNLSSHLIKHSYTLSTDTVLGPMLEVLALFSAFLTLAGSCELGHGEEGKDEGKRQPK